MTEYPTVEIEEFFTKTGEDVFHHWRIVGHTAWMKEKTPYTEVPYAEYKDQKQADK